MRGESTDDFSQVRYLRVRNVSGEEIPGGAAMQVVGVTKDNDGQDFFFRVDKPAEDSLRPAVIIFNTRIPIASGADGAGVKDLPFWALIDQGEEASPLTGDDLGTLTDDWALHPNQTGFVLLGLDEDDDTFGMVVADTGAGLSESSVGCGLYLDPEDGNKIKVDVLALAGPGLIPDPDNGETGCALRIACYEQEFVTDVECDNSDPEDPQVLVTKTSFPVIDLGDEDCVGEEELEDAARLAGMAW